MKRKGEGDSQMEMLVSVSKHHFKRAVKRNLVKRQLREGYRLHKVVLADALSLHSDAKLLIAFIWMSGNIYTAQEVETMMVKALEKVARSLVSEETVSGS